MQSDCQQHEPTEASQQNIANRSRNSLPLGREGCQRKSGVVGNTIFARNVKKQPALLVDLKCRLLFIHHADFVVAV